MTVRKQNLSQRLPRSGERLSFGRDSANHVVLSTRDVSRFHAELAARADGYHLKDCNSHNGTFVNGNPIDTIVLKAGDLIEIGVHKFRFSGAKLEHIASGLRSDEGRVSSLFPPGLRKTVDVPGRAAPKQLKSKSSGVRKVTGARNSVSVKIPRTVRKRRSSRGPDPLLAQTIQIPPLSSLTQGESLRFGRDPANDVVIKHPHVSRFHSELLAKGSRYVLNDWDSHNGTFVNGARVETAVLRAGDRIGIGGFEFLFDGTNLEQVERSSAPTPQTAASDSAASPPQELRAGWKPSTWRPAAVAVAIFFVFLWKVGEEFAHIRWHQSKTASAPSRSPMKLVVRGHIALQSSTPADMESVHWSLHFPEPPLDISRSQVSVQRDGTYLIEIAAQCQASPRLLGLTVSKSGFETKRFAQLAAGPGPLTWNVPDIVLSEVKQAQATDDEPDLVPTPIPPPVRTAAPAPATAVPPSPPRPLPQMQGPPSIWLNSN